MKRFLLALPLLLLLLVPKQADAVGANTNSCTNSVAVSSITGATKVVSGVSGSHIQICGVALNAVAAGAFQVQTGNGTTCGSNTTNLTGSISLAINGVWIDHVDITSGMAGGLGLDICIAVSSGTFSGVVYYGYDP